MPLPAAIAATSGSSLAGVASFGFSIVCTATELRGFESADIASFKHVESMRHVNVEIVLLVNKDFILLVNVEIKETLATHTDISGGSFKLDTAVTEWGSRFLAVTGRISEMATITGTSFGSAAITGMVSASPTMNEDPDTRRA